MKNKKDMQVEDSPSLETQPKYSEAYSEPAPVAKPGFFKRILPWIIVAVVFFLFGTGLVYFTLYSNVDNQLGAAKTSSAQLTDQLSSAQVDLQKAKSDLGTTQSALTDANNALTKAQQLSLLYKFQADVNLARIGLYKLDPSTARQALSVAGDDLTNLKATSISQDAIAGLQPQIDTAVTNVEVDSGKAMDALDTLYTNLLLISGNIK
jgi:hypothetical protein